ncbi:MAG: ABC transporter ATP-binding protein, partial [Sulfitobacter sp.]|nr:ABC transporter ATP-binding protein [Sulfitobacter sp.]
QEFMVLLGASGCGKSTLLRIIAGLETATSGEVWIGGKRIDHLSPKDRGIAMVFQNYAVFPHLTVFENIGFGLRMQKRPNDEVKRRVERVAGLMHIEMLLKRYSGELSGGQRQRVGICRALIQNPALLLVDEPTASLDPKTSRQIMRLICELCRERGLAAIINIHDVALAQMFVQRVIGLRFGAVEFDGPPEGLTPDVLTTIYGEEDWEATIEKVEDDEDEVEAQ